MAYHLQSGLHYDSHRNWQNLLLQLHQSPPAVVAGAFGPSTNAPFPRQPTIEMPAKRGPGRPRYSKNKPKSISPEAPKEKRKPGRPPRSKNKPKVKTAQQPLSLGQGHQVGGGNLRTAQGQQFFEQRPLHTNIPTGYTHPTTAQNHCFGQNEIHHTPQAYNGYQASGAYYEHLSSSQGQHVDTRQPLNINATSFVDHTHQNMIAPHIDFGQYETQGALSMYTPNQVGQAYGYQLSSFQNQHVHLQQPLNMNSSLPSGYIYPTTTDQSDYVGQNETQYTLPIDNANQAYYAYDHRLSSSPDQHNLPQQQLTPESPSRSTSWTRIDQQNQFGQVENVFIPPDFGGHKVNQVFEENLLSSQDQHLSDPWSEEDPNRTSLELPSPHTEEDDIQWDQYINFEGSFT